MRKLGSLCKNTLCKLKSESCCELEKMLKNKTEKGREKKSEATFLMSLYPGLYENIAHRSLGALRAPTSSLRPFGPALGPSGLLDFVLRALRALRPCDPRIVCALAMYDAIFFGNGRTDGQGDSRSRISSCGRRSSLYIYQFLRGISPNLWQLNIVYFSIE